MAELQRKLARLPFLRVCQWLLWVLFFLGNPREEIINNTRITELFIAFYRNTTLSTKVYFHVQPFSFVPHPPCLRAFRSFQEVQCCPNKSINETKCLCRVNEIKCNLSNNPDNQTCFPEEPSSPSLPGSPLSPFLDRHSTLLFSTLFYNTKQSYISFKRK